MRLVAESRKLRTFWPNGSYAWRHKGVTGAHKSRQWMPLRRISNVSQNTLGARTFDNLFQEKEAALIRARKITPKPTVQISSTRLPEQASTPAAVMRMSPITKPDKPSTSNTRDIGTDPMSVDTSLTEIIHPRTAHVLEPRPMKEQLITFQRERILTELLRRFKWKQYTKARNNHDRRF